MRKIIVLFLFLLGCLQAQETNDTIQWVEEEKFFKELDNYNRKMPGEIKFTKDYQGGLWEKAMVESIEKWNNERQYGYTVETYVFMGSGKIDFVLIDEIELLRAKCRELNSGTLKNTNTKKSKYINK